MVGNDPYAILVSELMLQQTQVARVVPRFEAWLQRWPDAAALAAASLPEVLGAWVGLGYNRRAKALWEAAGIVARDGWPEDLTTLPGVGAYTAAALGAFAFGRDELPVDVNVRRVLDRTGLAFAGGPENGQALMELGALVCRARSANCPVCPLAGDCASAGLPLAAPVRRGGPRERFEDSDRFARGRVLAALAGREPWPEGLAMARLERALTGLERDGLVARDDAGAPFIPGAATPHR